MNKRVIWISIILISACVAIIIFANLDENKSGDQEITVETDPEFTPKSNPPGSESKYDIHLTLIEDGTFHLETLINIKNTSEDFWNELVFYFIPNVFTENHIQNNGFIDVPGTVNIHEVILNGDTVDYELDKDTLAVPLPEKLEPDASVDIKFIYEFTLPENGLRFSKINENYHLAHFYPMVATYRNNEWNKEDYMFSGETYHTNFSDFTIEYAVPDGYTVVTSSEEDPYPSPSSHTVVVKK